MKTLFGLMLAAAMLAVTCGEAVAQGAWMRSQGNPVIPGDPGTSWRNAPDRSSFLNKSISPGLSGVRRMVPQDYATIQGAIDASNDGDTVLVSEGTYYENIRYGGRAIVVGSLYAADGDPAHIARTIIDGSRPSNPDSASVVSFVAGEDTTSVLCGFTITGGTGTVISREPNIRYRLGGGIFCDSAGMRLMGNVIARNRVVAANAGGGGVAALTQSLLFVPVVVLDSNLITNNYAQATGTADWCIGGGALLGGVDCRVVGNVFEEDTVVGYLGAMGGGLDIHGFRRMGPPYPLPNVTLIGNVFRSNSSRATQAGAIGGGSCVLWTGEGTLQDNLFEGNVCTSSGSGGWAEGGGLVVDDESISGYGRKMVVHNRFLGNEVDCAQQNDGGGLLLYRTLVTLSGNEVAGNTVARFAPGGGGGIGSYQSSFRIENNIIVRNSSGSVGGGLTVWESPQGVGEQVIINNTFLDNYAAAHGGGLYVNAAPKTVCVNNIFWNDSAALSGPEIYTVVDPPLEGIAYCDVKGGYAGTAIIDGDPGFPAGDSSYHLIPNSSCVEGGIDSIQFGGVWYHAPLKDYDGMPRPSPAGSPPDLGAHEEQVSAPASARDVSLDRPYARPGVDTLCIRAMLTNVLHHTAALRACFTEGVTAVGDSVSMYDDGLHVDGAAGDGVWGCLIRAPSREGMFAVDVYTEDLAEGTLRRLPNAARFTTAGPLEFESFIPIRASTGLVVIDKPAVGNRGSAFLVPAVTVTLRKLERDTVIERIYNFRIPFGDIGPDSAVATWRFYSLTLKPTVPDTVLLELAADFASGGLVYWSDTLSAMLGPFVGIAGEQFGIPADFELSQNYPNPFNPSTTIRYGLPARSHVTLAVYNMLGQQVAILRNGEQEPGYHEVRFDASGLASGVYLYRLQAGDFVQVRKLLVLR